MGITGVTGADGAMSDAGDGSIGQPAGWAGDRSKRLEGVWE